MPLQREPLYNREPPKYCNVISQRVIQSCLKETQKIYSARYRYSGNTHFFMNCGTTIGTESPARPNSMIVEVGFMDNPSAFIPQAAIFTCDAQPSHNLPGRITLIEKRLPKNKMMNFPDSFKI